MNPAGTATVFQSLLGQMILLVVIALVLFQFPLEPEEFSRLRFKKR